MIDVIKQIDGYEVMTAAEIAATLIGRRWTVSPIPVADLTDWLRANKVNGVAVGRFGPDGAWEGVLRTVADGTADATFQDALYELMSHLRDSRSTQVSTHEGLRGGLLHSTALACGISAEQRTSLYALGGGERFGSVTAEQVQAALDGESRTTIKSATLATVQAQIDPLQSKINAISSWLATEAALAMAPDDYQAYADALLISADGNPA